MKNLTKIYKYSTIFIFIIITLFRIQIYYTNKIDKLSKQVSNFTIQNSILVQSLNYVQGVRIKLRDEPIYGWPIHIDDYDRMTSEFGYRRLLNPFTGKNSKNTEHSGIDLVGTHHARVVAVADGIIVGHWLPPGLHSGKWYKGDPLLGGKIILDHENGQYSVYGHLDITYVQEGQRVFQGDVLGRQGNTGFSTGDHLHFELWDENKNPIQSLFYLKDPTYLK